MLFRSIQLWLTDQSDIEAEFCDPRFLSALTNEPIDVCQRWLSEILVQNAVPIGEQFAKQRAVHNAELHKAGGSPTNNEVWDSFQDRTLKGAKGKFVYNQLKNKVPRNGFSDILVESTKGGFENALSLKTTLEMMLA